VNVDPELRKRVEQIKSSPVQLYREAGDYSNRELVEGILVSPDDIAAIEAVTRGDAGFGTRDDLVEALYRRDAHIARRTPRAPGRWTDAMWRQHAEGQADDILQHWPQPESADPAEAAHHRMVQPDHYQRWER
jgi:hypothetical protein